MKALGWLAYLTPFDRKLLVVVTVLVALSFSVLLLQKGGSRVVVSADDKIIFVAPLDQDKRIELEGPLGVTVLEIENGAARITSSPCARKVCMSMGTAQHSGDLIACVPNQLVIRVEGDDVEDEEYDFIRR